MGNLQTAEQTWPTVPGAELLNLGRAYRRPLGQLRLQRAPTAVLRRREAWALAVVALLLHGGVLLWVSLNPAPALPIVPPEVPPNRSNRVKYRCPKCATQVWGKPELAILCGGEHCGGSPFQPVAR